MRTKFYIIIAFLIPFLSNSQEISKSIISDMKFRHVGPVGNRLTCVAGVADQPMVYYVGAASRNIINKNLNITTYLGIDFSLNKYQENNHPLSRQ